jgi:biopolymer transport protein ExbD
MKRHRRDYEMMADMNLTNLLDTAFVLLITFIIASPTMRNGLDLKLPEVTTKATSTETPTKPLTISIQKKRELPDQPEWIFVDGTIRVDLTDGPDSLRSLVQGRKRLLVPGKTLDVVIEMDKDARYDVLAKVLGLLQLEGIDSIGLPMNPETSPPAASETSSQKKTAA